MTEKQRHEALLAMERALDALSEVRIQCVGNPALDAEVVDVAAAAVKIKKRLRWNGVAPA
jgi:hypothetical protein